MMQNKVILVTGGAKRIGAAIVQRLHDTGANVILHYRHSQEEALRLSTRLNQKRPDSVVLAQADLLDMAQFPQWVKSISSYFGKIDGVVNNASSFFATPMEKLNEAAWDDLVGTNLKAPLFLAQALAPYLIEQQGAIVNIADIHATTPMREHIIYNIAKAGLVATTRSLALELAPHVRVNAVAPGANIWPEGEGFSDKTKENILSSIPLARVGTPEEIAKVVSFLLFEASYITGQVLNVDGGRGLALE